MNDKKIEPKAVTLSRGVTYLASPRYVEKTLARLGLVDVRVRLREFPLLAGRYAAGDEWPLRVRNALAEARVARGVATEAWVFARKG